MEREFSRTGLLLGKEALEKLALARVAVFGLGGVGGYVVEALARSGVGALDIVDNDRISLSNINRQILATHSTVGRYKTDVAKERILDINPNCKVNAKTTFFLPATEGEFDFGKYDYVVDAIDTVAGKLSLAKKAHEAKVPIISAMGAGNKLDPTAFEVADIFETSVCPLAKVMRRELKKMGINRLKVVFSPEPPLKPEPPLTSEQLLNSNPPENSGFSDSDPTEGVKKRQTPGSVAFVPPVVGLIIAGEVVKDIINKK